MTGSFTGNVTFGSTTLTSSGVNIFVAKLDANGDYEWATKADGTSPDSGKSVSVLADGSSIVTGQFQGNATFGNTTLTSTGGMDVFVAKLNADGVYQWATKAGGTSGDYGYGVSALEVGSSIVTGYFTGNATFGNTTLTSAGSSDVYIAKLDADGEYKWAKKAGGASPARGYDVSVLTNARRL